MTVRSRLLLWGQQRIEKGAWYFAPISLVWAFISWGKNVVYDWKWRSSVSVACPVISVGNLVVGGTGKTPLVHLLASKFPHRRIAILSRGYGEIPDEPRLLQNRLPFARVYVGKDRVQLAKKAVEEGAELIVLDDGFQYRKLHRDFDLVLLSGVDPWGKGHYLPWGFLRDSPKRLLSADTIFVSGKQKERISFPHVQLDVKVDRILEIPQLCTVFGCDFCKPFTYNCLRIPAKECSSRLQEPSDDCRSTVCKNLAENCTNASVQQRRKDSIQGMDVAIFCGIAKPSLFEQTVRDLGANVVSRLFLADHEQASDQALCAFAHLAKKSGAKAILCTEKDAVKYVSGSFPLPLLYLEISLEVVEGKGLWENLIAKIDQKIDNFK